MPYVAGQRRCEIRGKVGELKRIREIASERTSARFAQAGASGGFVGGPGVFAHPALKLADNRWIVFYMSRFTRHGWVKNRGPLYPFWGLRSLASHRAEAK